MYHPARASEKFRKILGVDFFTGSALETLERVRGGGLVVVPAAPALKDLPENASYREALLNADVAITDSSLMVMLWNLLEKDRVVRVSGLEYFKVLAADPEIRAPGQTLWIMASAESACKNLLWLRSQNIEVRPEDVYLAPLYRGAIEDETLLERLALHPYRHVIITVGGGTQERLGFYLKSRVKPCPAIHCIGAAIAFLSGDQVYIPDWADQMRVGWLLRCLWKPKSYIPRYWRALKLVSLMYRYREKLPPLRGPLPEERRAA